MIPLPGLVREFKAVTTWQFQEVKRLIFLVTCILGTYGYVS